VIERWLRAYWTFLAIGILAALLGWQTLRIEGFRAGHITAFGMDQWLIDLASCTARNIEFITAQTEAGRLQAVINEDEERRTAANAERSDVFHAQDKTRAAEAGRDYADRHRITAGGLRAETDRGASSQALATAESGRSGVSAEVPADTFVAVSDPDLQACTAAVTYAVAAHNWAATIPAENSATEFQRAD